MDSEQLRALQAPLKQGYLTDPASALVTLRAEGTLGENATCNIGTSSALVEAGLHPATGGGGLSACSGDMLLQSLVACAGVTLGAVATSLGIELRGGSLAAEGDLDFRGTLGVAKDVPVGFQQIRLSANPALHFVGQRCNRQPARETSGFDKAVLRRIPDASQWLENLHDSLMRLTGQGEGSKFVVELPGRAWYLDANLETGREANSRLRNSKTRLEMSN